MEGIARHVTPEGIEVFSLTDGAKSGPVDWFEPMTQTEIDARLGGASLAVQFNAFLIRQGAALTLVDTGYGTFGGADAGRLPQLLAAMGVAGDQIGTLFFTHLHTDHSGGALDEGAPAFPKARVVLHADEAAHWRGRNHHGAQVLSAYSGQTVLAKNGAELLPQVRLWHLPGHTPGHSGLQVGTSCAIVGDLFHAAALQLPDPDIVTKYDVAKEMARATRQSALAKLAADNIVIAGSHAVTPLQFCRILPDGGGYRAVAA